MVANRTREIRPSGMKRGAWGNMGHGGTWNPLHIPKGCMSETLHLKLRAPQIYPDHEMFLIKQLMDYEQFSKRFTLFVQFQGLTPFPLSVRIE